MYSSLFPCTARQGTIQYGMVRCRTLLSGTATQLIDSGKKAAMRGTVLYRAVPCRAGSGLKHLQARLLAYLFSPPGYIADLTGP